MTSNFNSTQYADPSQIRLVLHPLLLDILDYTTPPLLLSLLTTLPSYLLSVPMNPLPLHIPHASVGKTIPLLLPPHVTQPHQLLHKPSKHLPDNAINDQLTSQHSSQATAIHYSLKTTSNVSPANNPKNSQTTKSALLLNNSNAISHLTQQTKTILQLKALHYANLSRHTKPSLLCAWLQLYANPTVQFSYPKTLFWRHKYDENAHRCVPRPHRAPDIPECLERLTCTLEDHFQPHQSTTRQFQLFNNALRITITTIATIINVIMIITKTATPNPSIHRTTNLAMTITVIIAINKTINQNRNNQNYSSNRQPYPNQQQQQYSNQQLRQQYNNRQNNNSNQQSFRPNNQQSAQQNQQQPRPQQQQNQRPNNYDNRNNSSRNYDPRQQNSDRRNNQYQHNNVDEVQQDFFDITSNKDLSSYDISDYDPSQCDYQDAPIDIDPNQPTGFSLAGSIHLVPLTSRQNNITGTSSNSVIPPMSPQSSPPPSASSTKSEPPWRHRKHLLTSTARISDHPVPVLFDEGSQVNMISPQLMK